MTTDLKNIVIIFHGIDPGDLSSSDFLKNQEDMFYEKNSYIKKIKKLPDMPIQIAYAFESSQDLKDTDWEKVQKLDHEANYLFYANATYKSGLKNDVCKMPGDFQWNPKLVETGSYFFRTVSEILQVDPQDCLFITHSVRMQNDVEKYPIHICGFHETEKIITFLQERVSQTIPPISSVSPYEND